MGAFRWSSSQNSCIRRHTIEQKIILLFYSDNEGHWCSIHTITTVGPASGDAVQAQRDAVREELNDVKLKVIPVSCCMGKLRIFGEQTRSSMAICCCKCKWLGIIMLSMNDKYHELIPLNESEWCRWHLRQSCHLPQDMELIVQTVVRIAKRPNCSRLGSQESH